VRTPHPEALPSAFLFLSHCYFFFFPLRFGVSKHGTFLRVRRFPTGGYETPFFSPEIVDLSPFSPSRHSTE